MTLADPIDRPTMPELLERVGVLLPEVAARAPEIERTRTLPDDLVAQLEHAGLFRLQRVRPLGGLEADPAVVVDVVERLAHADAATAWAMLIGMTSSAFFGRLDPDVAATMLAARPAAAASCVVAPTGTATPRLGGYRVAGHWAWNSGVLHCPWREVAALVTDEDGTPRVGPDGAPEMRLVFLDEEQSDVVEHWDTMGLRGTGSHDLAVGGVLVPEEHTAALDMTSPSPHEGPYGRFGMMDLVQLGVVGFPLGVARRALDELAGRARTKTRGLAQRWTVADDGEVQADVGRAEAALAAARAFTDAAVGELWDSVQEGDPDPRARERLGMATAHGIRVAVEVVDVCYRHAGASAMRLDDPLQRCFRDLHAVAGHVFYSAEADRTVGHRRLAAG